MASTVFGGPGPLFLLLLALAVDLALGGWTDRFLPDPARLAQRLCSSADRRLNRAERSPRDRLLRGALVGLVLLAGALVAGLLVQEVAATVRGGWLLELAALVMGLRGRASWLRVRGVRRALEQRGLPAAQEAVSGLTRRHLYALDEHGVARAAIEHLARAFDRRLVAPAFWYMLLGLPGLFAWIAMDGADAALGRPGTRHAQFGLTVARLDDALNAIPARLAALLLALAGGVLGGARLSEAFRTLRRDARKPASLNMGWPVAAMAGALGLSLGGPHRDGGVVITEPWLGDGRARAVPADIGRALGLAAVAALLLALLVGLALVGVAGI